MAIAVYLELAAGVQRAGRARPLETGTGTGTGQLPAAAVMAGHGGGGKRNSVSGEAKGKEARKQGGQPLDRFRPGEREERLLPQKIKRLGSLPLLPCLPSQGNKVKKNTDRKENFSFYGAVHFFLSLRLIFSENGS